jgi:hypothetical protein
MRNKNKNCHIIDKSNQKLSWGDNKSYIYIYIYIYIYLKLQLIIDLKIGWYSPREVGR